MQKNSSIYTIQRIALVFSIHGIISSPIRGQVPNPFATPEAILNNLGNVQHYISKTFNNLLNDFKASATPQVNPIVTNETQKYFAQLKASIRDLSLLNVDDQTLQTQANQLSNELYTISLSVINAIQAIDGNLQSYFDTFPEGNAYKEVIDDSLRKLQDSAQKAQKIGRLKKSASLDVIAKAGDFLSQIAKTAREKTLQMLDLVKVPKKSKNPFKRLFGK